MIYGGGGDDKISGGPNGNDTICGGPGDDTIHGGPRRRHARRRRGRRPSGRRKGGRQPDRRRRRNELLGAKGPDDEFGGSGDDELFGGRGPDEDESRRAATTSSTRAKPASGSSTAKGAKTAYTAGAATTLSTAAPERHGRRRARRRHPERRRRHRPAAGQPRPRRHHGGPGDEDVLRGDIGFDKLDGGPWERDIASFSTASEAVTANLADRDRTRGRSRHDLRGNRGHRRLGLQRHPDRRQRSRTGWTAAPATTTSSGGGGGDELFGGPDGADCSGGTPVDGCEPAPPAQRRAERRPASADIDGSELPHRAGHPWRRLDLNRQAEVRATSSPTPAFPSPPDQRRRLRSDRRQRRLRGGRAGGILLDAGAGNDSGGASTAASRRRSKCGSKAGPAQISCRGGPGDDVIEAGDDSDPDVLEGGPGATHLIGARTDLPVPYNSGKSTLIGGPGSDVMVGGDPCDGDIFDGGTGRGRRQLLPLHARRDRRNRRPRSVAPAAPAPPATSTPRSSPLEGSPGPDTLIGGHRDDS